MKKVWLFILWLFSLIFVWNFTQAKDYEYTNLDITADVKIDGTIDVKEKFTANFFVNKHWIIRDIPLNYSVWWKDFHIEISNINVFRNTFTTNKSDWEWHIKIWNADRTVIWEQKYSISYSTYGLIRNFSWMWYAELYRNLVWYGFDTNINRVKAEIILPKAYTWFTKNDFLITTDWKSKTIDWFEWTVDRSQWDRIIITYNKVLPKKQGITLSVKFPNNYFEFDNKRQARLYGYTYNNTTSRDNETHKIILIICISYIILSLIIIFVRLEKNYNKKSLQTKWELKWTFVTKYPVIIQYSPPEWLNSAEVWLLLHRWATYMDVLSLVYKWINEWILSIKEDKAKSSKTTLIKIKDIPDSFSQYEKTTFNDIFKDSNSEKEIYKKTHINFDDAIEEINKYWEDKWWLFSTKLSVFKQKFNNISLKILIFNVLEPLLGIILFLFMGFAFCLSASHLTPSESVFPIIILFTNTILFCFALIKIKDNLWVIYRKLYKRNYLKETEEWAKLISHILWYREFLKTCEENKLKKFLKEDPLYFDKVLPYVVVFWLETELIEKIKPIMEEMKIVSTSFISNIDLSYNSISAISDVASKFWNYSSNSSSWSSYDSDSWWDSWSSFDSWWSSFDSWWGWGWWWWSSW